MIEVKNLTKIYGHHKAADNISFTVNDGEILGFLGPNGAGKTTTMNMMTGFISASSGSVVINGYDILESPLEAKKQLGYLPDVPPLYGDMRVDEYLDFVCDIKQVKKSKRAAMLEDITSTVGISHVRGRIVKNLSKGYRQRVGLAQAMIGYPSVLILDEPTVGLDPQQIIEMRSVIKKLGERHTILLSSHILSEVSAVCDRIMIINNGKIVISDTAERLTEGAGKNIQLVRIKGEGEEAAALIEAVEGVERVEMRPCDEDGCQELRIDCGENDLRADIVKTLTENNIPVVMLKSAAMNLEEVFLKVINGEYEAGERAAEQSQAIEETEKGAESEKAESKIEAEAEKAESKIDVQGAEEGERTEQ